MPNLSVAETEDCIAATFDEANPIALETPFGLELAESIDPSFKIESFLLDAPSETGMPDLRASQNNIEDYVEKQIFSSKVTVGDAERLDTLGKELIETGLQVEAEGGLHIEVPAEGNATADDSVLALEPNSEPISDNVMNWIVNNQRKESENDPTMTKPSTTESLDVFPHAEGLSSCGVSRCTFVENCEGTTRDIIGNSMDHFDATACSLIGFQVDSAANIAR